MHVCTSAADTEMMQIMIMSDSCGTLGLIMHNIAHGHFMQRDFTLVYGAQRDLVLVCGMWGDLVVGVVYAIWRSHTDMVYLGSFEL